MNIYFFPIPGDLRVCTYCCKVVLSYLQSSDIKTVLSADLKALQEDLEEKYGTNTIPAFTKSKSEAAESESLKRKPSVGYMEERYASGRYVLSLKKYYYKKLGFLKTNVKIKKL